MTTEMKTTAQWLERVENDYDYFVDWMKKQYRGEVRASIKVREFAETIEPSKLREDLMSIADDESRHANWIRAILIIENIEIDADQENADNRYWREVMDGAEEYTRDEMLAAGAHAETMRLHRIAAVADSEVFQEHITKTFSKIFTDELRHATIFRDACSDDAYRAMSEKHEAGLRALGLEI